MILHYSKWITVPQTQNLITFALYFSFLKTVKRKSRWLSKAKVRRWDMCPEPTEFALDWLFDRINLDPQSQIKHVDTKKNSQTWKPSPTSWTFQHFLVAISVQLTTLKPCRRCLYKKDNQGEENRCGGEIKTDEEFSVEDCRSVSNSTGFECIPPAWDTQSTKFQFGPRQYGETRCERFEWKHSIELSSVTSRWKSEHQNGETRGGNDKETHLYKIVSPRHGDIQENVGQFEKVYSNVRRKLGRQPEDDMLEIDVNAMILGNVYAATMQASVHLGENYRDNFTSHQEQGLRKGQAVVQYFTEVDPESRWRIKLFWFSTIKRGLGRENWEHREFNCIDGEPIEFECNFSEDYITAFASRDAKDDGGEQNSAWTVRTSNHLHVDV